MPATFSRTLRSMHADGPRWRTVAVLLAAVLLAAWLGWFLLGRVAVYEITDRARLEVEIAAHPVAARVGGQVVETRLKLGRDVRQGDVLVELDSEKERLALEQSRTRLQGLEASIERVRAEIVKGREAAEQYRIAGRAVAQESRSRVEAAVAAADLAEKEAETEEALSRDGVASEQSLREAKAKARSKRAEARASEHAATRLLEERDVELRDRDAAIAKLERQAVDLQNQAATEKDAIRRLERDVAVRRILAPVDGRIGNAAELQRGSVVEAGEELGSIVPRGAPRVVAFFPVAAVGRVRPGQPARLRLDGFPWTQFGTPLATVRDVGNEPSGGRVRVELTLDLDSAPAIPLEHGLTGSVEVEVERLSPAEVVLRAAGRILSPASAPPPDSASRAHSRAAVNG